MPGRFARPVAARRHRNIVPATGLAEADVRHTEFLSERIDRFGPDAIKQLLTRESDAHDGYSTMRGSSPPFSGINLDRAVGAMHHVFPNRVRPSGRLRFAGSPGRP